MASCIYTPSKVKDPITGKKVKSKLFSQLELMFPRNIAQRIYNRYAKTESIEEFVNSNPGVNVLDDLGQPTIEVVMQHPDMETYIKKFGLNLRSSIAIANTRYAVGRVSDKGKIIEGTENFQQVANVIGEIYRTNPVNGNVTVKVYKQKVKGKWLYATEIVPKTSKNEAELQKFIDGCITHNKMKVILAKSGVASEVVESLPEGIDGQFDPTKPRRVMHSLFNLIKLNNNLFKKGGTIEQQQSAEYEEMGHTIIAMFKNNPQTKDAYENLVKYLIETARNNPQIFLKTNKLIDQNDINQLLYEFENTTNNVAAEEILGKIMAGIIALKGDSTVKELLNSQKKIIRVLNKAENIFKNIVEQCAVKAVNTLIGTTEKTANIGNKLFNRIQHSPSEAKKFDWWRWKKDSNGMSKILSIAERNFFDKVEADLTSVLAGVMQQKFDVKDALRNRNKLNRLNVKNSTTISTIQSKISNFYEAIDNMGYGLAKGMRNIDLKYKHVAHVQAFINNSKNPIKRDFQVSKFIYDSFADLKSVVQTMQQNLQELDEGFKDACDAVNRVSEDTEKQDYLTFDVMEVAANITNFDKQVKVLTNASQVIQYVDNILQICNELQNSDFADSDKETVFTEAIEPVRKLLEAVRDIYNQYSKAALCIQFGVLNNGRLYIDRGARLMNIGSVKEAKGKSHITKKLEQYKGRKIPIKELLEELKVEDGYFDMNLVSLYTQAAANSPDNITQFIDRLTKQSKFIANKENARWHKAIIDFRNYCRKYNIDISKFFELDSEGNRTGNIVSNINWGLWEKDQEESRRKIKIQGIASYIAKSKGQVFENLSKKDQDALIQEVENKKDLSIWNELSEYEQMTYLYTYAKTYYYEFHNTHSIDVNTINAELDPEQLPESARIYDPTTDSFKQGFIRTQYSAPTTLRNEDTGETITTDELSLNDLGTRKMVPNLNYDNGRYRNKQWDKLSTVEKEAIQKYLSLKAELDAKLNRYQSGSTVLHRMPQFRGTTINRMVTEGVIDTIVNSIQETIFQDSEDQDFGSNATINDEESSFITKNAFASFEMRQRLPMFGVNKLKNVDQLTSDLYRGLLSYAVMANNVEAMSNVAPISLLTRDILGKRKIENTTEGDFSHLGSYGTHSYIYQRFSKYVEMQVFGRYTSQSKQIGGKRVVNWNKIFKKLSAGASWTALAGNFIGGTVNTFTGVWNIAKEAGVGEHFTKAQLLKAYEIYTKNNITSPFGSKRWNNNVLRKFVAYWDCVNKNDQRYSNFRTIMPPIFKLSVEMCHYENGDNMIHIVPYIAKALNTILYERHVDEHGNVTYTEAGNAWDIFVKNCDRMRDSEQIKASRSITTEDHTTVLSNQLSMNPYAYTETQIDPQTGEEVTVVKQYYKRTTQFTQELEQVKYLNAHSVQDFKKKQEDIDNIIEKKLLIFREAINNNASYADTDTGKKMLQDLKALCDQYNKYVYLIAQAIKGKELGRRGEELDLKFRNLDLSLFWNNDYKIPKETVSTLVKRAAKKTFKFNKYTQATTVSTSDLDYETFNDQSQAQWKDSCRGLCNNMHGIYNSLDSTVASQTGIGAAMLAMKKYYLGYLVNQYLGSRDSLSQGTDVDGCVSAYYKLLRVALRSGFYNNDLVEDSNGKMVKSAWAKKQSAKISTAVLGHFFIQTALPFAVFAGAMLGAPVFTSLGAMVATNVLNRVMQNNSQLRQGYASVMSNSQRMAVQRMFKHFRTSSFWKIITMLFAAGITKIVPDQDDDYLWKFHGEDDPRLKYPDIYELLKLTLRNVPRDEEGNLDIEGIPTVEALEAKDEPSKEDILIAMDILKELPELKGKEDQIEEVANMMLFAKTKEGKALADARQNAYIQSNLMWDQKFLQWVAGLVHSVNPSFNAHIFDDYAAKMAYGIKMTKEDNYAYNIKGLARYFTVDTIDDSIIKLRENNYSEYARRVEQGVIPKEIDKILTKREQAAEAYAELEDYIGNYKSKSGDSREAFIMDHLANILNNQAYCDEQPNPNKFISNTYLFDAIDYFSSRWLTEQVVLSPSFWYANPYDLTPKGAAKEFKAQWTESLGGIITPVLASRSMDLMKWAGDISSSTKTSAQKSLEKAISKTADLNIDDISDYDINNLPKFQRLLAKYADMKYSIIGDNGFFNSFIDLVLPTQKRITSIQDFEKLKKQYHQMRNK